MKKKTDGCCPSVLDSPFQLSIPIDTTNISLLSTEQQRICDRISELQALGVVFVQVGRTWNLAHNICAHIFISSRIFQWNISPWAISNMRNLEKYCSFIELFAFMSDTMWQKCRSDVAVLLRMVTYNYLRKSESLERNKNVNVIVLFQIFRGTIHYKCIVKINRTDCGWLINWCYLYDPSS